MNARELIKQLTELEPFDAALLTHLRSLPVVRGADTSWFHGWVLVRVTLTDWTWDARSTVQPVIDAWAQVHAHQFAVSTRYDPTPLTPPEHDTRD